jgi:steroid Delta-isomerase
MPDAAQIEASVRSYVDSYNRADLAGVVALFAEDATVEDPVGTPLKNGRAEITEFFKAGIDMGAKLTLDGPVRCAADHAAFAFHVTLDWEGQTTRIDVIDTFRFDEAGKVAEMHAFFGPENMGPVQTDGPEEN